MREARLNSFWTFGSSTFALLLTGVPAVPVRCFKGTHTVSCLILGSQDICNSEALCTLFFVNSVFLVSIQLKATSGVHRSAG